MNVQQRVRRFVIENFYVSDPSEIGDDTLLVTTGVVDSTGMLELIGFLETEFGIRIEDREMTPENLESIERMAAFVERKRQPGNGPAREGPGQVR
jgi:acyl carrier protein